MADSPAIDVRPLTPDERLGDALFTGLRLVDGIDLDGIRSRYGVDVWHRYGPELEPFRRGGSAAATGSSALADAAGHASCPRGDGGFRMSAQS